MTLNAAIASTKYLSNDEKQTHTHTYIRIRCKPIQMIANRSHFYGWHGKTFGMGTQKRRAQSLNPHTTQDMITINVK